MLFDMKHRPSGTASGNPLDILFAQVVGQERHVKVTEKIRAQTGLPATEARRPSVHLRWGLQQMKLRGWSSDDWGRLFDDEGRLGDGPICILEAVQSPLDAPAHLGQETVEQFYIRLAFVELGQECPVYISVWNDAQEDFAPVETVMNKAIELAEADEAKGDNRAYNLNTPELAALFGITKERLDTAKAEQDADSQV